MITNKEIQNYCQDPDLNWRHEDFQSTALPTELSRLFKLPTDFTLGESSWQALNIVKLKSLEIKLGVMGLTVA